MKEMLSKLIKNALHDMGLNSIDNIQIEYSRDPAHGDFACNIALLLSKRTGRRARDLANDIVSHIPAHSMLAQAQVAGNGFINFYLTSQAWQKVVGEILHAGHRYGHSRHGENRHIHMTVSSPAPLAKLSIADGRNVAYGATLANLLHAIGCTVHREFFVHDTALSAKDLSALHEEIHEDLEEFGIHYQHWYSERALTESGIVERAIATLRDKGHLYELEGAVWFRASAFGDDKDHVVIRDNGQYTFYANNIAYHMQKLEQGYNEIIDILGVDQQQFITRIKAALQALNLLNDHFIPKVLQNTFFYRDNERINYSTAGETYITLRELRYEIGKNAARFFYIFRDGDQHLDFDVTLAKNLSLENPLYQIQFANAQICHVFRQCAEKKLHWDQLSGLTALDLLESPAEKTLLAVLTRYPETIEQAANQLEPYLVAHYLRDLAYCFHSYYNAEHFLVNENNLRHARLSLLAAIRQVLSNGLELIGVSAPENM